MEAGKAPPLIRYSEVEHTPFVIRSTLAIELEKNVLTGIAARCKVHEGTDRVVLEDRALKATRDDREVKCIVEDIGHVRLVADMLSSLLVELRLT